MLNSHYPFLPHFMDQGLKTEEELDKARGLLHDLENSNWFGNIFPERISDARLQVNLDGVSFDNPVLVGPGWDKIGKLVNIMYQLGFAGIEVGSVLKDPQPGNPKPRFFAKDGATLNKFGFNSPGADEVAKNLNKYAGSNIPVGISIGKNKEIPDAKAPEAHAAVVRKLYPYASYFVINVSSPNTPGLRRLQNKKPLKEIISAVLKAMESMGGRKSLYVKIAPDLENKDLAEIIEVVINQKISGIIASNTTIRSDLKSWYGWREEAGGLAGDDSDFRRMVTEQVAFIRKHAGKKLAIIAAGGVKDARTALEKIIAGANAIQVVSALITDGPMVAQKINHGLLSWMDENGVKNISEIVGIETKKYK